MAAKTLPMKCLAPFALALLALAGCARDTAETERATPMPPSLPGVYSGDFPCSNCAAIAATLWLRPDGAFFLRQRFVDSPTDGPAPPPDATATFGLGRWQWDETTAHVVLRGAGPERRLTLPSADRLRLVVASRLEHLLAREPVAPPFADRLMIDGESAVSDGGATFTECLTGLTFPVADAGAYRELRRQHRRVNPRGKIALTTVEARLEQVATDTTSSERLVIERFVTMKPGMGCRSPG